MRPLRALFKRLEILRVYHRTVLETEKMPRENFARFRREALAWAEDKDLNFFHQEVLNWYKDREYTCSTSAITRIAPYRSFHNEITQNDKIRLHRVEEYCYYLKLKYPLIVRDYRDDISGFASKHDYENGNEFCKTLIERQLELILPFHVIARETKCAYRAIENIFFGVSKPRHKLVESLCDTLRLEYSDIKKRYNDYFWGDK